MNKNTTSMDFDSVAKAGSVMSHEITHMFGNRVEAFAHEAGYFGYQQITEGLARDKLYYGYDEDYARAIVAAAFDRRNWEENTGDVDYWKLIKRGGTWGWQEDGSLNFDMTAIGLGADVSPEEMQRMILNWRTNLNPYVQREPAFRRASDEIKIPQRIPTPGERQQSINFIDFVSSLHSGMGIAGIRKPTHVFYMQGATLGFLDGTAALANASIAAENAIQILSDTSSAHKAGINAQTINGYLNAMNEGLLTADAHHILFKSPYKTHNGRGTIFALNGDDSTTMTSDYGWRVTTWQSGFFGPYQLQNHQAWDLWAPEESRGLMSPDNGSLS